MQLNKTLRKIAQVYKDGGNIMSYLKTISNQDTNSKEAIAISYDLQAGSYIKKAKEDSSYIDEYTAKISEIINKLGPYNTLMEAGVGEATTLCNVVTKLSDKPKRSYGFDISWSRIKFAKKYAEELSINGLFLFMGDMFSMPINDNSIDIVYTAHSIDANGGKEAECIKELYRVTKKYLVLIEQSYEFAGDDGKKRMKNLGYATEIYNTVLKLDYKIIDYRLLGISSNPLNPTGVIIIEKNEEGQATYELACPITLTQLTKERGAYFSKDSLLVYPIIDDIPCLLPGSAIIATHYTQ
jgi:uncharacterized protein YbaR (Trm112 family)